MKKYEKWLFSAAGVILVLVILLGINILGNFFKVRADLTEGKLYSLSDGTKRILNKLDTEVEIRFYYSRDNASMPVQLRTYAQEVSDLLAEYQQAGHGKIKIVKLDPKPDSDAEDSARIDGVEAQTTNLTDKIYLGLAVSCLDAKQSIPFLSPERETLLEYDISRAISSVANPKKAVVGVMSALPVLGKASPMMMMQRQQPTRPWIFVQELRENYALKEVPETTDRIDPDISVLLLLYPKDITEAAQYAIDQFLLRGGRVIALLDPFSFVDSQLNGNQGMGGGQSFSANLPTLLKAWGLTFTDHQVVVDPTFATRIQRGNDEVQGDPSVLSITAAGINRKDPLGAATTDLLLPFVGSFTGKPADGLTEEVIVASSDRAGLVDATAAQLGGDAVKRDWKAANTNYPLVVRLTGKFKTAYPNGVPVPNPSPSPNPSPESSPTPKPTATPAQLKEGDGKGVVILIGDSDFAFDTIAGREQQVLNQTVYTPSNGNLNLIESAVEQLAGDSNLIGIRSRASANRPFLVVNQMEAEAEEKYQAKIDGLQNSLNDTRQKLAELQSGATGDQKTVLSAEQQAEIKKFQETEAKTDRELKQVRKDLRQEIDHLQTTVQWLDIAAMPLLVTALGLGLAWYERKRRAAR
ncbi:MAG: Gldg family protein [Verrucomicrobia bacterium]|nr:Gldg family protein [Verrucomicrobiota bacterium]